jgi:hypothetical protein
MALHFSLLDLSEVHGVAGHEDCSTRSCVSIRGHEGANVGSGSEAVGRFCSYSFTKLRHRGLNAAIMLVINNVAVQWLNQDADAVSKNFTVSVTVAGADHADEGAWSL